jgi:rubrerythrin
VSEKTATDRLSELLDERGIEYKHERTEGIASYMHVTKWNTQDGKRCYYHEIEDGEKPYYTNLYVEFNNQPTPEQAIAVTMGAGTCEVEVIDTGNEAAYEHYEHIMHCKHCNHEYGYVQYDEDGDTWMDEPPKFCPNCGTKVVSE